VEILKKLFTFDLEENMLAGIFNLFGAGAETTSNTLSWSFYFLAKNPEVQEKMFQEIDAVVGTMRLPSVDDKPSCVLLRLELSIIQKCNFILNDVLILG
jgi:cytochrome P450